MTSSAGTPDRSGERLRFVVVRGDEKCRVSLKVENSQVSLGIEGTQELGQLVRDIFFGLKPDVAPTEAAEKLRKLAGAARERFQELKLAVHDIPDGDMQIQMEMDLHTGQVLGTSTALHPFTQQPPELARKIHKSIKNALHKDATELTSKLQELTAAGRHEQACRVVIEAQSGLAFQSGVDAAMFTALRTIEIDKLSGDEQRRVLEIRVAVGSMVGRYVEIEADVNLLLKEQNHDNAHWFSLRNALGIAAVKKGQLETALSIWRQLLKQPENIHAGERGWIWRNVSKTLPVSDPEAMRAARHSADAFLEAGDKVQAAQSLMMVSKLLEHSSAEQALEQIDVVLTFIGRNGLKDKQLLAGLHHAKGNRLRELRNHGAALQSALEAVSLLRGILGLEEQFLSSLHLAQMEAQASCDEVLAGVLNEEAKELEIRSENNYFLLSRRIGELLQNYSSEAAEQLLSEARALRRLELMTSVRTIAAIARPDLEATARLQELEDVLSELRSGSTDESATEPVLLAISHVLTAEGEYERAAVWLRRLLAINPFQLDARDKLLALLWKNEEWGDAATLLAAQLRLHGEQPGLLFAYGKSLLNSGDASGALGSLQKCLNHPEVPEDVRTAAVELRERALNLGAQPTSAARPLTPEGPVLREEVADALRDFARFVSADKRMVFWVPPDKDKDYTWVERPERRAQDLLHTFLKARFQHRVSVYEEISAGAGRLDILLRVEGGMSVVIELKMCGFGYPSTYAASGAEQIRHYMESRSVRLGYLVIMDARLNDCEIPLLQPSSDPVNTVSEVSVNVRPRVSSKKKSVGKNGSAGTDPANDMKAA
jgi:tetratricopeptide (TPR) repeat protein